MDEQRRGESRPVFRPPDIRPGSLLAILIVVGATATAVRAETSIPLSAAREQGTFNVGPAHATATRVHDPATGEDSLKVTYTIPPGTSAGVYSKAFPTELGAGQIDLLRLRVKPDEPGPAPEITAAIEIKGSAGVQRIGAEVRPDGGFTEQLIDWPAIGTVQEVVLLISGTGDHATATGTLLVNARFEPLPWLRKQSLSPGVRFSAVLLAGVLAALAAGLLRRVMAGTRIGDAEGKTETISGAVSAPRPSGWRAFSGDLLRGMGVVLTGLLALETDLLGSKGPLEAGWDALGVAVAGAALAAFWKYVLTGKPLSGAKRSRTPLFRVFSRPRPAVWQSFRCQARGRKSSC